MKKLRGILLALLALAMLISTGIAEEDNSFEDALPTPETSESAEILVPEESQQPDVGQDIEGSQETLAPEATEQPDPEPVRMTLSNNHFALGVGETARLNATFSDGQAHQVTYATSAKKIATVTDAGIVKGVKAGTAVIAVVADTGERINVSVQVYKAPSKVTLSPKTAELAVGSTGAYVVTFPSGAYGGVTFVSSDPSVLSVDALGNVAALKPGKATVTVTTYNKRTAASTVTVYGQPDSMSLSVHEAELGTGETLKLTATIPDGTRTTYAYISDAPEIASVDGNGAITAHQAGEASITVSTANGLTDTCKLIVFPAPEGIEVFSSKLTLGVGETSSPIGVTVLGQEGVKANVSFLSSKPKVASVSADGRVKGLKTGTAVITVSTYNGKTAKVAVTVSKAPTSVAVSPAKAVIGVGESGSLQITLSKGSAGSVTLSGYDESIISVSGNNVITGLAVGTTRVTVTTYNGKQAYSTIEVKPAPQALTLYAEKTVLGVGEKLALNAALDGDSAGRVTYASENPAVASVNPSTGEVTAIATGEATIVAVAYNGVQGSVRLQALSAPAAVRVTPSSITMGVGETVSGLSVDLGAGAGGAYTMTSSNKKVVEVTADGRLKGLKAGSATITVKTYNNKTAKVSVKVQKAPTGVSLKPGSLSLGVGERQKLAWTVSGGGAGNVTLSSSNLDVAAVDADGTVTALNTGSAVITARTYNGLTASCTLQVLSAPSAVLLDVEALTLGAGQSGAIGYAFAQGEGGSAVYSSSDPSIVSVNALTGAVKAVKAGTATVSVQAYNGVSAAVQVQVAAAPTGVKFQEKSVTVAVGGTYQLLDPILAGTDARFPLIYTSSNSKYCAIDENGLITGLRKGSVKVRVTTYNGKIATLSVTVVAAPDNMWFVEDAITLAAGVSNQPEVRFTGGMRCPYTLASSDESVVRVESDGQTITAVGAGTVVITGTSYNGKTDALTVEVPPVSDRIQLDVHAATLGAGEKFALSASLPAGTDSAVKYVSSNGNVIAVSEAGLITAVAPGSATVQASTATGASDVCECVVLAAPTALFMTPEGGTRGIDEGDVYLEIAYGAEGEGGSLSFATSDSTVAIVSENGVVSFRSTGDVTITVRTYNNLTASVSYTVMAAPTELSLGRDAYTVPVGDRTAVAVSMDGGGSYSLSVEDSSIARVENGKIVAVGLGTTKLTATAYNGVSGEAEIIVVDAPTAVILPSSRLSMILCDSAQLTAVTDAERGVGTITYASQDPAVVSVDAETGVITSHALGSAVITATSYNGAQASCTVNVNKLPAYHALVVAEYASETISGNLPFAVNNALGVSQALNDSGLSYGNVTTLVEQGKTAILDAIRAVNPSKRTTDVSVVYLSAHGLNTYSGVGEYVMGTTAFAASKSVDDLISATELMAALNSVSGKVILILDSCYSGAFLDKYAAMVESNPNLAVITSSHGNTRSSYWNVQDGTSVDFFTYALLEGLGYDERQRTATEARADLDGDGYITLQEAAEYAEAATALYVQTYSGAAQFNGTSAQRVRYSINGLENMPIALIK